MSIESDLLSEPPFSANLANPDLPKDSIKKRKRGVDIEQGPRKSIKKAKNPKKHADDGIDIEMSINNAFSHMDNQLLADYVAQRTRTYESDLSSVELEDKYIPANSIQDTTSWSKPRTLENLPSFLENFSSNATKLWSASKKNGAPHTIIVTAAGLRAADLARALRPFQAKGNIVAKLFAKHIKIEDSIKFLQSTRTGIAVGTPARLKDLMDNGALVLDRLERIIIDASHIDQKKRGILEMKETQVPLTLWLGQKDANTPLLPKYDGESTDVLPPTLLKMRSLKFLIIMVVLSDVGKTPSMSVNASMTMLAFAANQNIRTQYSNVSIPRISGQLVFTVPRNPDHDSLRRREAAYLAGARLYGSGSDAGFPTQSAYLTQSIGPYLPNSMLTTPSYFPLQTPTTPASTSIDTIEPTALTTATYIAQQVYTSISSTLRPYMVMSILVTVASMYLAFDGLFL
ncbi:hypothetical protein B7494_g8186 [Chlorociboria aeruginascens]|nr:hypothetical protein B7494_g8186 [Chlorociboria aeruginascens]